MQCPACTSTSLSVYDSRPRADNTVMRRRRCSDCGHRFTTTEKADGPDVPKPVSAFGLKRDILHVINNHFNPKGNKP